MVLSYLNHQLIEKGNLSNVTELKSNVKQNKYIKVIKEGRSIILMYELVQLNQQNATFFQT